MEEDAAKLVHAGSSGRIHSAEASVVDFNRGGTPLVEIVTEPDLRSAAQASEWLRSGGDGDRARHLVITEVGQHQGVGAGRFRHVARPS